MTKSSERKAKHNLLAKKGVIYVNPSTGEASQKSDFARGYNKAIADNIHYHQVQTAKKKGKKSSNDALVIYCE